MVIYTDTMLNNLLTASVLAYQLVNPNANISVVSTSSAATLTAIQTNQADLGFYVGAFTPQNVLTYPYVSPYLQR